MMRRPSSNRRDSILSGVSQNHTKIKLRPSMTCHGLSLGLIKAEMNHKFGLTRVQSRNGAKLKPDINYTWLRGAQEPNSDQTMHSCRFEQMGWGSIQN